MVKRSNSLPIVEERACHDSVTKVSALPLIVGIQRGIFQFLGILASFLIISSGSVSARTTSSGHTTFQTGFNIIDAHEHIRSRRGLHKLRQGMKRSGVIRMILVGSPEEVLGGVQREAQGFTDPERNNNEILQISKMHPGVFYPFATFSPNEKYLLGKLTRFIEKGGRGLKLYNGHHIFRKRFKINLDAPHLLSVYKYCEEKSIPIIYHANARLYWSELKNILDRYPDLVINLPHFCMSLINLDRMRYIFDRYPNVYTDISFGHYEYAYPALEFISNRWQIVAELIRKYRDRFLFGTDMVLTDHPEEDEQYVYLMLSGYRKMLEQKRYTNILIDQFFRSLGEITNEETGYLNGLHLDRDTLRYIYEINPRRFLGLSE